MKSADALRPRARRVLEWLWRRRWKTAFAVLIGVFALNVASLPFGDVAELRTKNPTETAFMQEHAARAQRNGTPFSKVHFWTPLKSIPKHVVNAVIVAEDGTFWSHSGIDWFEVRESIKRNIAERRVVRGASTITQQLVKNLYLSSAKNPLRKANEWILTWYMERTLTKSRILELYLNLIEWGEGVYGVEAASRVWFGKSAGALSREEAARLAAVIPNPKRYRPTSDSRFLMNRVGTILHRMEARGF